eukprot:scaffold395_cov243-Pinguiococcus_pyrenoidosus.AAC.8
MQQRRPVTLPKLLLVGCSDQVDQYRDGLGSAAEEQSTDSTAEGLAAAALKLASEGEGRLPPWRMGSFGRQAADVGTEEEGVWLPEYLAIEMTSGTFYVWEAHSGPASTSDTYLQDLRWQRYPPAANESDTPGDQAVVYRLDAVLSGVSVPHAKEEVDEAPDIEDAVGGKRGFGKLDTAAAEREPRLNGLQEHFVCHSRVPKSYVERALSRGWGAAQAADASGKGVPDPSFLDPRAPSTGAGSLDAEDEFGRAVGANPNEWQWVRCNDFSCGRASSTEGTDRKASLDLLGG